MTTLFSDDFTGQSGAPANWIFGNAATATSPGTGDTFGVVSSGGNPVLRYAGVTPVDSVLPIYHTTNGYNFLATGDKVLQLNLDLTVPSNWSDYRFGLYNATGTLGWCSVEAYEVRIYPTAATSNVTIYSYNAYAVLQDNVTFTVNQALLQGTHSFALQLDFTASATQPVIRVYSNGTLLAQLTANAAGGFHPSGTDAQAVHVMTLSGYAGYTGAAPTYDVDNVVLTSFTAGSILLGNLQGSTTVNPLIFGHSIVGADSSYIFSPSVTPNPDDDLTTSTGFWDPVAKAVPPVILSKARGDMNMQALRYPGGSLANNFNWKGAVGPLASRARSDWKFGLDEYLAACAQVGAAPVITCSDYCLPASQMPQNLADLVDYLNAPAIPSHPWAMQRAANGHAAPYGVKYFELGNETNNGNDYVTPSVQYSPDEYCAYANSCIWAMRAIDPSICTGLVLVEGTGQTPFTQWNTAVIQGAGPAADFAIVHMYTPQDHTGGPAPKSEAHLMEACMAVGDQIERQLQDYHSMIAANCGHDLPLAITEYNASFARNTGPAYRLSLAAGLECADLMRVFLKPANGVLTADYWQWINGYWGMLQFTDRPATSATAFTQEPAYPLFRLWGQHFGASLTNVAVTGPTSTFSGEHGVDLAQGTAYQPETLLSGPTALLGSIAVSNFNSISGLSATKTSDTLQVVLTNYNGTHYPWIASVAPPAPYNTNGLPVNYRVGFQGGYTPTSSTMIPFYVDVQDSRGWAVTQSSQGVGPILDPVLTTYQDELHSLSDSTGASIFFDMDTGGSTVSGTMQVKNPTLSIYSQQIYPKYNLLTASASTSTDGHTVYLLVFNKSILHIPAAINLNGFTSTSAKQWQVNGPNLAATSGVSEVVSGASLALASGGGSAPYVFPAHSMTAFEFYR